MTSINLTLIEQNLEKSGFLLEHQVTEKLMADGWGVINNRYYVDDVQETAREIDLIAYKAFPIKLKNSDAQISIYTTLIISCKKSERNLWSMLFRDLDEKNPNMDWFPVKNWSNNKALKYILTETDWRSAYAKAIEDAGIYNALFEPTGHLFAYQEIDKKNHTIQNQTNIFNSVSSLMKAESYEMSSLERRKKDYCIYNFNLISIIDSELVKVHCKGTAVTSTEVDEAKAIFNYIVNKQETASRIHFITFDALDDYLSYYDELYKVNKFFFGKAINDFYENIFSDKVRIKVVIDDFNSVILPLVNSICGFELGWKTDFRSIEFYLSSKKNTLEIALWQADHVIEDLNKHGELNQTTKKALKDVFNYSGNFIFIDDYPF